MGPIELYLIDHLQIQQRRESEKGQGPGALLQPCSASMMVEGWLRYLRNNIETGVAIHLGSSRLCDRGDRHLEAAKDIKNQLIH